MGRIQLVRASSRIGARSRREGLGFSGFTLIELLVVIGIIGVLVSILLPTLSKTRESAKSVVCRSNQRQLALAMINYTSDHKGRFPYVNVGLFAQGPPLRFDTKGYGVFHCLDRYVKTMQVTRCPTAYQPGEMGLPGDVDAIEGQVYVLSSNWPGGVDWACVGTYGDYGLGKFEIDSSKIAQFRSPSQTVMIWEEARPLGSSGNLSYWFSWFTQWGPNGYYAQKWRPFHGARNAMNFTFVDGHSETIITTKMPNGPYGGSTDWTEQRISLRKDFPNGLAKSF